MEIQWASSGAKKRRRRKERHGKEIKSSSVLRVVHQDILARNLVFGVYSRVVLDGFKILIGSSVLIHHLVHPHGRAPAAF